MTTKRKTGKDYRNELKELDGKRSSLKTATSKRLLELVGANPEVNLPTSRAGGLKAIDIDHEWIIDELNLDTIIQYIETIEKYLADKHPHQQTKIDFSNLNKNYMITNNPHYIMYGHLRTANLKSGEEAMYFNNIYNNAFSTQMCGNNKIYKLAFEPAPNLEINKTEVEYWGWLNNKGELSMVHANYFLFDMCFPNGAKATEEYGQGKRVKLILINFTDNYKE